MRYRPHPGRRVITPFDRQRRRPFRQTPLLLLIFLVGLGLLWSLPGCGSRGSSGQPPVCVAGSTSVQPFAEKLAEIFMQEHPAVRIEIQGGGSSAGVFAARQGASDLGACSRELTDKEKDLVEIPIAWDGIAVIVNAKNPLTNLSLVALRRIYAGQITNWRELGLPPHAIHLITREEGSGTRNAFEELVMGKVEITPSALVQDSNGSVREIVANDPHALGYISVGLVEGQVKAVAIDGVTPTRETIKAQKYKLVRRFLLVSRLPPKGQVKDFVDFILSAKGQSILEQEGLVGMVE
jgi:phosphate transport system substrate-binding protein